MKINLYLDNTTTRIEPALGGSVYKEFKKVLGYRPPNYLWMQSPNPNWDGFISCVCYSKSFCKCAMKHEGMHFPTGLISLALKFFKENNISYELNDLRDEKIKNSIGELKLKSNPEFPLYDYQKEVVDKALNAQRGLIKVATGGGKCSEVSSLSISTYGILRYDELAIISGCGELQEGETKKIKSEVFTPLTSTGKDNATHLYRDGFGESRRFSTSIGYQTAATPAHRIKILSNSGIEWKYVKDLKEGDIAVLTKGQNGFGSFNELNENDAYFMGLVTGDGCWTEKSSSHNKISLTNQDNHIISFWEKYGKQNNIKTHVRSSNGSLITKECEIFNKSFASKLKYYMKPALSINKTIPLSIRRSPKNIVAAFIRGLYETDGWVSNEKSKPSLCIAFSSKELVDQLHVILLNFGIVAHRRIKKTTHKNSHVLTIYRQYIPIFQKEIGLDPFGRKYIKLKEAMHNILNTKTNTNIDTIPNQSEKITQLRYHFSRLIGYKKVRKHLSEHCSDITYSALRSWSGKKSWREPSREKLSIYCQYVIDYCKNINNNHSNKAVEIAKYLLSLCDNNLLYDKIISIKEDFTDNYDFVVPHTHSFTAQGFINHNTRIIAELVALTSVSPTIIYVTSIDLLNQMHEELEKFILDENGNHIKVGRVGGGFKEIEKITVMTNQTAIRALDQKYHKFDDEENADETDIADIKEKLKETIVAAKCVIFDETQHVASETAQVICEFSSGARWRWGASATPFRDMEDDILILACFGKQLPEIKASDLIQRNFLVTPYITFIPIKNMQGKKLGPYANVYKEAIVENDYRNEIIAKLAQNLAKKGRRILILVKQIAHGELLEQIIPGSTFIYGGSSKKKRKEHIEKMRNLEEDSQITISSVIFDEGINVRPLDALILAGSGKSSTRALQRIGRVIRTYKYADGTDKQNALVYDFWDYQKYLNKHAAARKKMYLTEPLFNVIELDELKLT